MSDTYAFADFIRAQGYIPPDEIIADGNIHRFSASGKRSDKAGWYSFHANGSTFGVVGNWRDGGHIVWQPDSKQALNSQQQADVQRLIAAAKAKREQEQAGKQAVAAQTAQSIWAECEPTGEHPYLTNKGVKAHGIRLLTDARRKQLGVKAALSGDLLVIPAVDDLGETATLQFIDASGEKRFLSGGRKQACYHMIGDKADAVLLIAEGFATGATLHEATGHATAIAFDAGNIEPVAKVLRGKYPQARIILCADDDWKTDGNPGKTKAQKAAKAIGGKVVLPAFKDDRQEKQTDFNDMAAVSDLQSVADVIAGAMEQPAPKPPAEGADVFAYGGGRFEVSQQGVTYTSTDRDGEEQTKWICSALRVIGMTRDTRSAAWGRLLQWQDADGVSHQWAMPLEMLQGDGADVRRELASQGVAISTNRQARELLATYLQSWPVKQRARCVERLGWHGNTFVLPSEAIGQSDEIIVWQSTTAIEPAFSISGTTEQWRNSVAKLAAGNSRTVFAICVAFAAPMADIIQMEGGGIHIVGKSSGGKTTALEATASVYGHPTTYARKWRATSNALEGLAALHNDLPLILDEIKQADPKDIGESAYLLANGQGKARASRTGSARQSARWRVLFLSAGEISLATMMQQAGKAVNAGMEIRLAEVSADAGAGLGTFECLHEHPSAAALSNAIKDAANQYHGAVGIEWLRLLAEYRTQMAEHIRQAADDFVRDVLPDGGSGQAMRVAFRFGLIAVAGEVATKAGLTGWQPNEAMAAARKCFVSWLENFGGAGQKENRDILNQVRAFIEQHGASRFEDLQATDDKRVINRAGFFRTADGGGREYLILPSAFEREVCAGHKPKDVTAVLVQEGWLIPASDRVTQKVHTPAMGKKVRMYVLSPAMWESEQ